MLAADEIEGEAARLYAAGDFDPACPPGGIRLARGYPGIDAVEFVRRLPVPGELVASDHDPRRARVRVRSGMSRIRTNWVCTHELVEYSFSARGHPVVAPERERLANRVTAAAIVPPVALRAAYDAWGLDLAPIADEFCASQKTVALRLGEVMGWSVAVVGTLWIARAGPAWLPGDAALRRLVADGGRGVRLCPLTDTPHPECLVVLEE
jgi:hypothetical protein